MPVNTIDVRDLTVQASGQYRGVVVATMDDGRVIERNMRAPDGDAWSDLIANIASKIDAQVAAGDAQEAVDPDADPQANKDATQQQVALAYLRSAMGEELAFDAFQRFDRFNNFRNNQGWTMEQVATNLAAEGLTADEWAEMQTVYLYLNGNGRPAIMQEARDIQAAWEDR